VTLKQRRPKLMKPLMGDETKLEELDGDSVKQRGVWYIFCVVS
jgi:hypothetical protein